MSQIVNSSAVEAENGARHVKNDLSVLRNATSEEVKPKLRYATSESAQDLLKRVTSAYTETELQGLLLASEFRVITYAINGNPDIVDVPIEILGHSSEARELNWDHVHDLALSDESSWPPLEVCLWPDSMQKLDVAILLRIITGNHRTAAAKEKGLKSLPVRIFRVEKEVEFRILAIYSNASHGLKFTEDECKRQARYLRQEGKTLDEIAAYFSKNKSTISRWVNDTDLNASRKIAKIVQSQPVGGSSSSASSASKMPIRTVPTVAQKIETLLIAENMSVSVQEAREYIQNLSAQKRQRIHELFAWLQDAREG